MKIRSIFLGTLILACFLYNQLGSQESFDPKIAALMDQVSRANLQTHIENLANADGYQTRASYTDGNLWAVDYMKKTFESFPGLTVDVDTFFV
ncbi:MAG TPA: hypothetical protein VGA99_02040, partial [bacterium]